MNDFEPETHYLERDAIAYFICGCAMELPTQNFKLNQHIIYRDKSMGGSPGDVSENPVT